MALTLTIVQGASWGNVNLYHPRDLSAGTARGQIRSDYLDRAGTLLADFTFLPLTFGLVSVNDGTPVSRTMVSPRLTGTATANIPYLDGASWVWDIFVDLGAETIEIASGNIIVVPRVTGGRL